MKTPYLFIISLSVMILFSQCSESYREAPMRAKSDHSAIREDAEPSKNFKGDSKESYKTWQESEYEDSPITITSADNATYFLADVSANNGLNSQVTAYASSSPQPTAKANAQSPLEKVKQKQEVAAQKNSNLKLIKTADLIFEVDSVEETRALIERSLRDYGGHISFENESSSASRFTVNMTLRMPKYYFEDMLMVCDSKGLGAFDKREIKTKDVSEEFVDLTARVKTKKELEKRYHDLLKKAKDVEEVIRVEKEIVKLRSDIEAKEGRLKYLSDRVDLSTIYVQFYKEIPVLAKKVEKKNRFTKAFASGWDGLELLIIGLITLWPFIIIIGLTFFFMLRWSRKNRKQTT